MTRRFWLMALVVSFSLYLFGCGKSAEQRKAEEAAKRLEEAGKAMQAAAGGKEDVADAMKKMSEAMSGGKKVDPVDFRELKALLPSSLPGMKRGEVKGEKTGAMGMSVSEAEAEYSAEGGGNIDLKISDMGGVAGVAAMAAFAWAMSDFDRETDRGYEKTTTYSGHKAFEKYDQESKHGEVQVLVGGRFLVAANGSEIKVDDLKNAIGKIDLAKLESMTGQGVQK